MLLRAGMSRVLVGCTVQAASSAWALCTHGAGRLLFGTHHNSSSSSSSSSRRTTATPAAASSTAAASHGGRTVHHQRGTVRRAAAQDPAPGEPERAAPAAQQPREQPAAPGDDQPASEGASAPDARQQPGAVNMFGGPVEDMDPVPLPERPQPAPTTRQPGPRLLRVPRARAMPPYVLYSAPGTPPPPPPAQALKPAAPRSDPLPSTPPFSTNSVFWTTWWIRSPESGLRVKPLPATWWWTEHKGSSLMKLALREPAVLLFEAALALPISAPGGPYYDWEAKVITRLTPKQLAIICSAPEATHNFVVPYPDPPAAAVDTATLTWAPQGAGAPGCTMSISSSRSGRSVSVPLDAADCFMFDAIVRGILPHMFAFPEAFNSMVGDELMNQQQVQQGAELRAQQPKGGDAV